MNSTLTFCAWVPMLVFQVPPSTGWSFWPPQYTAQEPLTVITVLLICAFAIDRIVTEILALLKSSATKTRSRRVYLVLAGVLGILLGVVGNVGVLGNLGFSANPLLNAVLTTLILMGGSDGIGALMAKMGGRKLRLSTLRSPLRSPASSSLLVKIP